MPGPEPDYQAAYYRKHKKRILRRKKRRYKRDRAYRELIKARARAWNAANRERARRRRRIRTIPGKGLILHLRVDGQLRLVRLYSLRDIGRAVGRRTWSVIFWRRQGILPRSPYRWRGWYLYTQDQVDCIRETFLASRLNSPTPCGVEEFKRALRERWGRMPKGVGDWRTNGRAG